MEKDVWRPEGYPTEDCPHHPGFVWSWDGFGWICSGCAVGLDDTI